MKFVKLWGGLGNQLFQFSFGEYLRYTLKEDVFYLDKEGGNKILQSPLLNFNCNLPTINCDSQFQAYFKNGYRLKRKILQMFPFLSNKVLVENFKVRYCNRIFKFELYDGYWQDLVFIDQNINFLEDVFILKDDTLLTSSYFYNVITKQSNSVSLHIRRTDFLSSSQHVNLDFAYYKNAMNKMSKMIINPIFFIFSDDINWVKNHFELNDNLHIVSDNSINKGDLIDFTLMSSCKHHIIANSSFSWWAARLNKNPEKIVIAPKLWYTSNNHLAERILPEEWIRIL